MAPHGPGAKELAYHEVAFEITEAEVKSLDDGSATFEIIGQPRAIRALQMAIDIGAKGYNVFATGLAGTGKRTAIMRVLKEYSPRRRKLRDVAFVHNFHEPDRPKVLYFDPGRGAGFRTELEQIVDTIRSALNALTSRHSYTSERDRMMLQTEGRETQKVAEFEQKLKQEGFEIVQVDEEEEQRTDIAPIIEGESATFDELQRRVSSGELHEDVWNQVREKYYRYMDEMKRIFHELRVERSQVEESLHELRVSVVRPEIESELARIRLEFPDARIHAYLDDLAEDILRHLSWFSPELEEKEPEETPPLWRYTVNVVVDHSRTHGVPIIFESHPDYQKLFGSQESTGEPQDRTSNFTMLRGGSLLAASGGFLILRAEDILADEETWNNLKRALQDNRAEIRPVPGPFPAGPSLKPEPIEVDVKVIVMGSESVYDVLYNLDEEFQKLFKVPAEFDSTMERNDGSVRQYIGFMRMICQDEGLRRLAPDGIAKILEYGVRLSEFRNKLSTQFSRIADLIRESDYWASREEQQLISRADVERALAERAFLYNMPEEKIDEQILSGELLMAVDGRSVGRINGLAVVDRGYYSFARPILITARVAPGDEGIINIERESGLSGEIHDKGIYILEGFLQSTYARDFPLSVRASVAFEQSYVEVDGDSASSTEIYVILSAIAETPLRQEIAVTGSVNQMGQVQPVGGISEKVEGFFEVSRKMGLTGNQGVIIPRQNIPNLILNREVQEAVASGTFHIYAIETIDDGIEILTGMPAGVRTAKGDYQTGSFNAIIERRLRQMARQVKEYGGG